MCGDSILGQNNVAPAWAVPLAQSSLLTAKPDSIELAR